MVACYRKKSRDLEIGECTSFQSLYREDRDLQIHISSCVDGTISTPHPRLSRVEHLLSAESALRQIVYASHDTASGW